MLFLSSTPSSQNLKFIKKCPCLSSLKTKFYWTQKCFDPSLERSWCEYFELCYGLSPYHLPPSSPGVLLEPPLPCSFKNEILGTLPSIYTEVLDWAYLLLFDICRRMIWLSRASICFWSFATSEVCLFSNSSIWDCNITSDALKIEPNSVVHY